MTDPTSPDERRKLIWARVYSQLLHHAIPDSRFNLDFLSFTPDFRGSADALEHITELPCYRSAKTLLITSDNSLEQLRCRALKDGKKVLVATYRLRRGFVMLDPTRIKESRYELTACLDGMEKPGCGQVLSIAGLRDEGLAVDMCITGGLVFNMDGVVIWEGHALFEVQWALLSDINALNAKTPVVGVAHTCQVVAEAQWDLEVFRPEKAGEVQCDYLITPERIYAVENAVKPVGGVNFDVVDPKALSNIPPLQELRGIRMMEGIMSKNGFDKKKEEQEQKPTAPSAEEQKGIDIVEKLMRDLR